MDRWESGESKYIFEVLGWNCTQATQRQFAGVPGNHMTTSTESAQKGTVWEGLNERQKGMSPSKVGRNETNTEWKA